MPPNYPMTENLYPLPNKYNLLKTSNKIYAKFSDWTHGSRKQLLSIIRKSNKFEYSRKQYSRFFRIPTGDINPKKYFSEMSKYKFILAPRGGGVDTHRFYEALSLNCLPIVVKTNSRFDALYSEFPCLILDDWGEIVDLNEDYLNSKYINFVESGFNVNDFYRISKNVAELYSSLKEGT